MINMGLHLLKKQHYIIQENLYVQIVDQTPTTKMVKLMPGLIDIDARNVIILIHY